ncbi:hypothetical protein LOTGIDRAFT_205669 [Lottia gigantea]|uniref:Transporter n=1 Tax=Lottia gigantea TaxID=225164 RepID=V4BY13_LOTGI|nr:hypothetical protein LOTGIDRAFT_205669 [Lottia gigantea]ESO93994.1 hypothetical protein LOTGIDRAFT_205669 [Lottia gigantea]
MDFMLSLIGYAVGLGNIWRFPYLCYKSGGGAFLIPYVIFMLLCGMPLFFMEVTYGQFASLSPVTIWSISPLFKGVGYGMVIISGIVCIYYNIIIAWTLYYLFTSMQTTLPWSNCDNEWNTEFCALRGTENSSAWSNSSLFSNLSEFGGYNASALSLASNLTTNITKIPPSQEFWQRQVLQITEGIESIGGIRWELFGCLILSWIIVFLCICKGVQSSGRVVYVTATFPYLILLILCVRGVTLPGAMDGLRFYLIPDWNKLLTFQVWGDAAVQIFYSMGMAWGGLITMASYNKFHNNIYRDAILVPLMNSGTSVFAGLVIFSVLGFMAHETGVDISEVATQGPGLAFVAYPAAIARLPISPLWAVLFFLMLLTVGLDTQFGMFETMTSAFVDEFPRYLRNKKLVFTIGMCVVEFVLGIPCIMEGGIYILQIMDWYCSSFSLMLMSLIECLVIAWVYGADRFYKDIELMIGYQPCIWWKICWKFITPTIILSVWLFSIISMTPVTYGDYEYPQWSVVLGWCLSLVSIIPLPVVAIYEISKADGPILQRIIKLSKPSKTWGPALQKHREEYYATLEPSERPDFVPVSAPGVKSHLDPFNLLFNLYHGLHLLGKKFRLIYLEKFKSLLKTLDCYL